MNLGGWLWGFIGVLVVVLGLAIAFGAAQWGRRSRDPAVERTRDEATRRNYEDS